MKGENFNVLLQRARRLRVVLVFVDLPVSALFYFLFFCPFLWAWLCCGPSMSVVSRGCYINTARRTPISMRIEGNQEHIVINTIQYVVVYEILE
jgi:hypothetical protein